MDVTDEKQVERLVAEAIRWGGKLDIYINNAGDLASGGVVKSTEAGSLSKALIEPELHQSFKLGVNERLHCLDIRNIWSSYLCCTCELTLH